MTLEAAATVLPAWEDLASRALEPNVFSEPAFALAAARHLGRRKPRLLLAWDPTAPGSLIALCVVARFVPGMPVSAWLHPQATAAFPLLDREKADEALDLLIGRSAGLLRPAGLVLHGLPAEGPTARAIARRADWHTTVLDRRSRAVVRAEPPRLDGKAGKEFRRQARRLAEDGEPVLAIARDPVTAFEAFLRLEQGGWKGARGTALAQRPATARFAREMIAGLADRNAVSICCLMRNGRAVAVGVVLRSGANSFFWKTAFDETLARLSPGAHLADAIGRKLGRDPGVALLDSCAIPGHTMIDRLWPERMVVIDMALRPVGPASALFDAGLALTRARRWIRAGLKRIVRKLGSKAAKRL